MNLEAIRAELPVLERYAYLNTGTFGPLPRRTAETMATWQRRGLEEPRASAPLFEEIFEVRTRLRAALAGLLGTAPETVALTSSTTEGCNAVVSGLRLEAGDEVVTTDSEHPGLLGALRASGADVRFAPVSTVPAAEALAAIEREVTPATRLIAVSHVLWTTGHVLPIRGAARASARRCSWTARRARARFRSTSSSSVATSTPSRVRSGSSAPTRRAVSTCGPTGWRSYARRIPRTSPGRTRSSSSPGLTPGASSRSSFHPPRPPGSPRRSSSRARQGRSASRTPRSRRRAAASSSPSAQRWSRSRARRRS